MIVRNEKELFKAINNYEKDISILGKYAEKVKIQYNKELQMEPTQDYVKMLNKPVAIAGLAMLANRRFLAIQKDSMLRSKMVLYRIASSSTNELVLKMQNIDTLNN